MNISAVHLHGSGDNVEVCIEFEGKWYKIIEDHKEGAFSWIAEEARMQKSVQENRRPSYESRRR